MSVILAADAVMQASIVKVLLSLGLLLGWARWATVVDKDAMFYHLNRRLWNAVQTGAGAIAFLLLFLVPVFIVGLLLAVAVIGIAAGAYVVVRNGTVDEKHKWRFDAEMFRQMVRAKRQQHAQRTATMRFPSPPAGLKPVPLQEDGVYGAHLLVEQLLDGAIRQGASRVDLAGTDQQFASQLTIDGTEYRQPNLAPIEAIAMIDYLKAQCRMDITDRRRRQSGDCIVEFTELGPHEVRLQTAGSTKGLTATVLVDPVKGLSIPLEALGLLDSQREALEKVIAQQERVVLVAAGPRQGRTTTLYALVSKHDPYTQSVVTIEPHVERELEGATQVEADAEHTTEQLQTHLLRDPAVAAVMTLADPQTAQLAAKAGLDGKRIYCGIKADDTFQALGIWIKAVGDAKLAAKSLSAIVSQRLVRKLCTNCRQKYRPDADMLRKINLPADRIDSLYKAGGQVQVKNEMQPCPSCGGRAFSGLTGAFEVMVIDDEARKHIVAGDIESLRAHLRRNKTLWLQEAALAKVVNGTTAITEVMRALGKAK